MKYNTLRFLGAGLSLITSTLFAQNSKPNIVLILVDDMGFSDLGCYGSEIKTPYIDALAHNGIKFSNFYNNSRCCPTRASLMTGLSAARAGVGTMSNMTDSKKHDHGSEYPGYRGFLNQQSLTIAEVLKTAGYATLMSGKWHVGSYEMSQWPLQRGFEKYYGCLDGAMRYFYPVEPRGIHFMNEPDTILKSTTDRPYYTTDAFTDYAIRFIAEEKSGKDRPFFLYLAYNAPHWPIQAHEEDIDKYRDTYILGWDKLREQRYKKQLELGLIDPKWKLSPRSENVPAWDSLGIKKQKEMALRMAVYAAMIDRIDQNIGKLTAALKKMGVAENTLIMFLSDNGACAEGGVLGRGNIASVEERNLSHNISTGEAWANASSTPFRLYKSYTHEGGAATPFFICWPKKIEARCDWYDEPTNILDIMPTLVELAGADYPETYGGNSIYPMEGISLAPAFKGKSLKRSVPLYSEHFGNAFIMDGDWKLVGKRVAGNKGTDVKKWELYNLKEDRTELNNMAKQMPEKVKEMSAQWMKWAEESNVYPKPGSKE
jgi:arylsulfatase A-like enzyme